METDSALKLFFGSFEQNEKNRDRKRLLELMRTSQSDSKKQHAHYYSLILAFFCLLLFAKTWRFDVCNRIQCIFNRFIIYFHSPESVKLVKVLCLLTKIHFSHHQKFLFDEKKYFSDAGMLVQIRSNKHAAFKKKGLHRSFRHSLIFLLRERPERQILMTISL